MGSASFLPASMLGFTDRQTNVKKLHRRVYHHVGEAFVI
ncbi:hypothetical protein QY95_00800 [Bacillus thermotolerans]|uniref:Uncharacterized protein n=1 Tax=Bacillus thermotolerans TaxID=1221996 RepID=A0A0F5I7Q5_BACTR|nr:hypothetical protein QY95_00800 [Bacillus thermotolerans]